MDTAVHEVDAEGGVVSRVVAEVADMCRRHEVHGAYQDLVCQACLHHALHVLGQKDGRQGWAAGGNPHRSTGQAFPLIVRGKGSSEAKSSAGRKAPGQAQLLLCSNPSSRSPLTAPPQFPGLPGGWGGPAP